MTNQTLSVDDLTAVRPAGWRARFLELDRPARVVAVVIVLVPVFAVLAPLVLAPGIGVLAYAGYAYLRNTDGRWPSVPRPLMWFGLTVVGLAALSAFWAVDSEMALRNAGKAGMVIFCGVVLMSLVATQDAASRQLVSNLFAAASVAAVLLLAAGALVIVTRDLASGMIHHIFQLHRINRETAMLVLLVFPAAASIGACCGTRWRLGWLISVTALVAVLSSSTALFALSAGLVVYALAQWRLRLALRVVTVLLFVGVLTAPLVPHGLVKGLTLFDQTSMTANALMHRLFIWKFSADRIAEQPVVGWGMRNARLLPEVVADRPDMSAIKSAMPPYWKREILPLHPHNGVIQIWLELGVLGAGLLLVAVAMMLRAIGRVREGPWPPAALAGLTTATALVASGYGMWQAWWLAGLWLALIATAAIRPGAEGGR